MLRLMQLRDGRVGSVNNRDSSNALVKQEEKGENSDEVSQNYVIC